MTREEFLNEQRFDNNKVIRLDSMVRENLKKGYAMEERFEDQLKRVDRAGAMAFDIINSI